VSRIACLLVPDLPVAAACRADPGLAGLPLALCAGTGAHAPIAAASRAARARGVRPGHTVAQARAIATDLVVRTRDPAAERSAALALADVAASVASRIEVATDGAVLLDAAGACHLVPSEAGLATALVARAAHVGLDARSAVGSSMTVAPQSSTPRTASRSPRGAERGFSPLPFSASRPIPPAATLSAGASGGSATWRGSRAEVATRPARPARRQRRARRGRAPLAQGWPADRGRSFGCDRHAQHFSSCCAPVERRWRA
jgi:protein ImuB